MVLCYRNIGIQLQKVPNLLQANDEALLQIEQDDFTVQFLQHCWYSINNVLWYCALVFEKYLPTVAFSFDNMAIDF